RRRTVAVGPRSPPRVRPDHGELDTDLRPRDLKAGWRRSSFTEVQVFLAARARLGIHRKWIRAARRPAPTRRPACAAIPIGDSAPISIVRRTPPVTSCPLVSTFVGCPRRASLGELPVSSRRVLPVASIGVETMKEASVSRVTWNTVAAVPRYID